MLVRLQVTSMRLLLHQTCCDLVLIGVQMDPATALRAVDMGPAADSPQAAAFRAFWGERAELRRFQVYPYCTAKLNSGSAPASAATMITCCVSAGMFATSLGPLDCQQDVLVLGSHEVLSHNAANTLLCKYYACF